MTQEKRAFLHRMMDPKPKLFNRPTRLQKVFEFDAAKISQYLIFESHHGSERVNSTLRYGPILVDNKPVFTVRKNLRKIQMYGREHVHHTLTFTFKNAT